MKKFISISIVLILSSCNFLNQLSFDEDLTSKINLQYNKEREHVDLIKITDFEWDNYVILGPYQITKDIEKEYNIDLSNISEYTTSDDSKCLLIFIKNEKATRICKIECSLKFKDINRLKRVRVKQP